MQAKDAINREATHSRQSMRAFMSALREAGDLVSISQPVRLEYEVAGCLAELGSGLALHFTEVAGTSDAGAMPTVDNLLNSLPRFALGLSGTIERMQASLLAAIDKPLPHRVVSSAPYQEVIGAVPWLVDGLPIPRLFKRQGGPYLATDAAVARDKLTGNLSIARLLPLDGTPAFVGIAPNHHRAVLARAARARGEKLDMAVCVGNHPAVLVAACLYLGPCEDEPPIADALLGELLEVVRCEESGLLAPARCECVMEGTLDAGEPLMEGPVSEFHGMFENYSAGIVATFSRLTRRRDAIFQVIPPGYHPRHCLLGGVAIAAGLLRGIRPAVSSVCNVAVGVGGAGRLHAVVALRAPRPGEARKAMFAVWAAVDLITLVTVVDDDLISGMRFRWNGRMRRAASRSPISSLFPACAPTVPSRSSKTAPSAKLALMQRASRVTVQIGSWRDRHNRRSHANAKYCAKISSHNRYETRHRPFQRRKSC